MPCRACTACTGHGCRRRQPDARRSRRLPAAYAAAGGGPVRFNLAGSNVLARQIVNGAPADVFISADEAQMDVVEKAGAVLPGSRADLVENQLAVVTTPDRADFVRREFARAPAEHPPTGDWRSRGRAGRRLRAAVSRATRALGCLRTADRADDQRQGGARGGRDRQRRRGDRLRHRPCRRPHGRPGVRGADGKDGPRIVYPAAVLAASRNQAEAKRFLAFLRAVAVAAAIFSRHKFVVPKRGQAPV